MEAEAVALAPKGAACSLNCCRSFSDRERPVPSYLLKTRIQYRVKYILSVNNYSQAQDQRKQMRKMTIEEQHEHEHLPSLNRKFKPYKAGTVSHFSNLAICTIHLENLMAAYPVTVEDMMTL